MSARAGSAALLAAAALGLAACGGDDEPTTAASTTSTTTTSTEPGTFTGTSTTSTSSTSASTTATEGAPIEEIVADAANVSPEEVECGDEGGLESVLGSGGTCSAAGTEYVVADYGEELELDTLTAKIDAIEETGTVRGDYLKPRRSKNGVYAVATLSITNPGNGTQLFDDFGEQARLVAGTQTFSEPFNVLNGVATDSFLWQAKKIKPGDTVSGDVVFDIPEAAAEELDANGAVQVLNFGDEGNLRRADQIGLLRTG
ncbi:MAG TPA: DUF4352 domain-containing protein [Solirubrobacterales bacterium]